MSKIVEQASLILAEIDANSNKVYYIKLYDDGKVVSSYGRVGNGLQTTDYGACGKSFYDKKIKEKKKKGYTELKVVDADAAPKVQNVSQGNLAEIARKQIKTTGSPELAALIDKLVRANIHQITSSTQIKFDSTSGLFSTPLGVVTLEGIQEGRDLLAKIKASFKKEDELKRLVSSYLRIVPHDVGMRFSVHSVFPSEDSIQKESDILDALESSYAALGKQKKPATVAEVEEQVFDLHLDLIVKGDAEFTRIDNWFESSKKRMHGYDRNKIIKIYKACIPSLDATFDTKLGNITEVFHGTSEANLLSILKTGLKVAPPSTAYVAGKMWGNGTYGAINSSKSLGYTFGRWGGNRGASGWLFVCDMAMGKIDYPTNTKSHPAAGCDSIWAKADKTSLAHDELIVYRNNQVKIKYLLEINP